MPAPDTLDAFVHDPGRYAAVERAAAYFGLPPALTARLLRSVRVGARASALLAERLGHGGDLTPQDAAIAGLPAEALQHLASRAGAVIHAARVRGLIRPAEIERFVAQHGEAAREAALQAGPPTLRPPARIANREATEAEDLGEAVARDGAAALRAWCDSLPDWAARRVRLKCDLDDVPAAADPNAADLIRRVAAS